MSSFRRLLDWASRSFPQRQPNPRARHLRCQSLEVRRLLAAEGGPYQFSGLYDAAGLAGDVSAEIRWGDGTTSAPTSINGGETSDNLRIRFDYSLDTSNFFSGVGQSRRAVLDRAAEALVGRFADDLTAISPGGANQWQPSVFHPSVGSGNQIEGALTDLSTNLSIPANEIIVYVGARDLPGDRRGVGGGGSFSFPAVNISCQTQAECDARIASIEAFRQNVRTRGESGADGPVQTDIAPSIASISFDNQTDWYFGIDANGIQPSQVDFMTIATHELAHVLGFGLYRTDITSVWANLTSGGTFNGPHARAAFSGSGNPPTNSHHWTDAVRDQFGHDTILTESIPSGTRQLLSELDFAAMDDLGWDVVDSRVNLSANHVYADNGAFDVELVLRGSRIGEKVIPVGNVSVVNVAPTLTATANSTVTVGQPLQITNIGQLSDPGFVNSAADPATAETFEYSINWGDGSPADTGTATIDSVGNSSGALTLASFDGSHTYATTGNFTVTLQVTDDDGGTAQASFTVTVNPPPALTLELNRTAIGENEGDGAATLTVRRSGPVQPSNQTITLSSNNPNKATLPATIVIPAGSDNATVNVRAIDDTLLLGDVSVELSASATGVDEDTIQLLVRDHEQLTATFAASTIREANTSPVSLVVRRSNTDTAQPLTVQVSASDASQLDLSSSITIPANEQETVINVLAVDDADSERTQSLSFTFVAGGYETGAAVIDVLDDEPPLFQNPSMPLDVNNSGTVTANDALRVINQLASRGGAFELDPANEQPGGIFLDTNGDYRVSAIDALRVINELDRQSSGLGEQIAEEEDEHPVDQAIGLLF